MRKSMLMVLVPAAMLAAACSQKSNSALDDGLKNDLALASQASPANQATISPTEAGLSAQPSNLASTRQPTAAPVHHTTTVHHTSSARRSSGSSSGSSSGGYYPSAPAQPATHVEKHTQRDAAIGAASGAVLGAMSSRNKVKGGIIGAAVGGILGGVIGNNVDKKTVPGP